VLLISQSVFTEYFNNILKSEDIELAFIAKVNTDVQGGSAYLTWINPDSTTQALLFSPLKMFYFLFSPIPLDWRGIGDIFGFCLDSSIHFFLFFIIISGMKYIKYKRDNTLVKFFVISALITAFIYAYGVSTAGTAMRHRTKIVPVLIVAAAISYSYKDKYKKDKCRNIN